MSDYDDEFLRLLKREVLQFKLTELEALLRASGETPIDWKNLPAVSGTVTATLDGVFEVKDANDATGHVEGYLSVFGNEDLGHDVVRHGAFTASLAKATATAARNGSQALYPFLWQHDPKEPIGAIVGAKQDVHGLRIRTQLNMGIEKGRQAYDGLSKGYMALSIGYKPTKYEYQGATRHLTEIDLKEGSAVTWAMNPAARAIRSS